MRVMRMLVMLVVACVFLCGCNRSGKDKAELASRLEKQEKQLVAVEEANRGLQSELDDLKRRYETLQSRVGALAEQQGQASPAVEEVVQKAVEAQLAAVETRRQEERDAQRRQAQQRGEEQRNQWQQRQVTELGEQLGLDDAQKEKVQAAWQTMRQSAHDTFDQMRRDGNITPEKMQEAISAMKTQHDEAMNQILTAEQLTKYKEIESRYLGMLDGLRDGGRSRRGNRGADAGQAEPAAAEKKDAPAPAPAPAEDKAPDAQPK